MATPLDDLEPQLVWRNFYELSRIPHGSRNEAKAADWAEARARALGCSVSRDGAGNVLISKAASPGRERAPAVCLQAHLDMVCEKNEGVIHDFLADPIPLYRDDDLLKAKGTTLGADNGVGVALALATLASPELVHGPLEVLLTVQEEVGMGGALGLAPRGLKAAYLVNLDGEKAGRVVIGCAGGADTVARRPLSRVPAAGAPYRLKVSGLKGGHSGDDIDADRANAIRVLAQTLRALGAEREFGIGELSGGSSRNAIAREASALVFLDEAAIGDFHRSVAALQGRWRSSYGSFEPLLRLSLSPAEPGSCSAAGAFCARDARAIVSCLLALPHGMESRNPDLPGLVRASTNLAIARTRADGFEVELLTRSDDGDSKMALVDRIDAVLELAGFERRLENVYPGWKPRPDSYLASAASAASESLFGRPMEALVVHSGLECGIIGDKHPGMEMIGIGPDMGDVHTPGEWVSVSSTAAFWKLLGLLLERLALSRGESGEAPHAVEI